MLLPSWCNWTELNWPWSALLTFVNIMIKHSALNNTKNFNFPLRTICCSVIYGTWECKWRSEKMIDVAIGIRETRIKLISWVWEKQVLGAEGHIDCNLFVWMKYSTQTSDEYYAMLEPLQPWVQTCFATFVLCDQSRSPTYWRMNLKMSSSSSILVCFCHCWML